MQSLSGVVKVPRLDAEVYEGKSQGGVALGNRQRNICVV